MPQLKTPFLGPAYVARSPNLADQKLINLYPELVDSKKGKEVGAFYMTPSLDGVTSVMGVTGPVQGMIVMGGNLYAVTAGIVYRLTPTVAFFNPNLPVFRATKLGTIDQVSNPVSMIENGSQVAIFTGTNGYAISGGALSTINLPFSNPTLACFQDGFGVVPAGGTNSIYQSNLNDLTTWDPLNFSTADADPDAVVAVIDIHREVWVLKQNTTEVWINAGLSGFVFQRLQGVLIELGTRAPFSLRQVGEGLMWLASNVQGENVVVLCEGYEPRRVSTHAIEHEFSSYATTTDAIAYSYQQEGHLFYVISFPTANTTWCYDKTTNMWHQRAFFSGGVFSRHLGNVCVFFNGQYLIGDYSSGNLYRYNLDTFLDDFQQRKWLRSWRALPKSTLDPVSFKSLTIDMETGASSVPEVVNGANYNPLVMLRWSDDGGHTWSSERWRQAGPTGKTGLRVKFNRLGGTKRNAGLDRIFELSSTDQFKIALLGAILE